MDLSFNWRSTFFMWKMARVDIVPDGVLIVIIGKGTGLLVMIYGVAIFMGQINLQELASLDKIPVYVNEDGDKVYFLDENEEPVFVDANELFGISGVMDVADQRNGSEAPVGEGSGDSSESSDELVEDSAVDKLISFTVPFLSDAVVRGEPVPFQIFVPQGWAVQQNDEVLSVRFEKHTYLNCYSRGEESDNKSYLWKEVRRVLPQYSRYTVARQDIVTMGKSSGLKYNLLMIGAIKSFF